MHGEGVFPELRVEQDVLLGLVQRFFLASDIAGGGWGGKAWTGGLHAVLSFPPGPRGRAVGPGHAPQPGTVCDVRAG